MHARSIEGALADECVLANRNVEMTVAIDPAQPEHAVICFDAPIVWLKLDHSDLSRFIEQLDFARRHMRKLA